MTEAPHVDPSASRPGPGRPSSVARRRSVSATRTIFHDVSFEVAAGEVFVILGGSGCGKSTLMRQMIGLLPPTAGTIEIAGHMHHRAGRPEGGAAAHARRSA